MCIRDRINAKWGRIDTLFNNAGIGKPSKTIDLISSDDWLDVVNTNLNGNFYCAKEAFFYMKNQQSQCLLLLAPSLWCLFGG